MSKKRWSTYRPPSQPRDESGGEPTARTPTPPKQQAGRPAPKSAQVRKRAWVIGGALAAVAAAAVFVGVAVNQSADELPDADRRLLDRTFVADGLRMAAEAEQRRHPFRITLREYLLRVEYFDATEGQIRSYEFNGYSEGYQVKVEDNYYDDYQPRPFRLDAVDSDTLVTTAEEALDGAEDPYSFTVTVEVDRDSGITEVVAVAAEEAGDDLEVVEEIEGASVEPR